MRTRLLVLLACGAAAAVTAFVAVPAAQADSPPPVGTDWSPCAIPSDRYCVQSETVNGVAIAPGDPFQPYVDTLDSGTVRYGVLGPGSSGDIDPADTYSLVVRTGSIRPRELDGNIRDVTFTTGGNAVAGWTFTLTFKPTPVHFVGNPPDSRECHIGACGNDTWRASLDYSGFVTGYVTDLASSGLSAAEIAQRTGMISVYNAQESNTFYDPGTNSLVVQLANPHRIGTGPAPGALATGSYQTFLPDAFLTGTMGVPDPATLSTGTVTVVRTAGGADSSAPFSVSHVAGGVLVTITGITYSSPTYRIHPGPGKPRSVRARKISAHSAKVRFIPPASSGGRRIDRYQARCHALGKAWHSSSRSGSPITVRHLSRGKTYCQVRAHNRLGWGAFSAVAHS